MPIQLSDPELFAFSAEHLLHEVKMFLWLPELIPSMGYSPAPPTKERVTDDACLDSFVVHTRTLIEFFFPRKQSMERDVFFSHFIVDTNTWTPGARESILAEALDRADKFLAHLSPNRKYVGQSGKGWEIQRIRDAIVRLLDDFVAAAAKERLTPVIGSELQAYRKRLGK